MQDSIRRKSRYSTLLLATILLGIPFVAGADETHRLNIILLVGDDHGWDETGYNDHPYLHTPVLNEMASSGLRFDHFYAAHPSCSPTRASLITGRHPVRSGTFAPGWSIRPEEIGIARLLSDSGYFCGLFGKWHLGPVKEDSPTNPGAMGFRAWVAHDNFFEMNPFLSRNGGPPIRYPGEGSAVVVEQAIEFLREASQINRPFFVMICFGSPHEPYSGLDRDLDLYEDLPQEYANRAVRLTSNKTGLPTTRPLRDVLQERYAEITAMDRSIGELRQWLDEQGLRDNTLLWYLSDNGSPSEGAITSPLRGHKAQLYEGGIRVPSLIEWPACIDEPRSTSMNAVTSDLLPTICDLLDLPVPDRPLDGISLKRLILDGDMEERPEPIAFWSVHTGPLLKQDPVPYIDPALQEGTIPLVKRMNNLFTRNFRNIRVETDDEQDFSKRVEKG